MSKTLKYLIALILCLIFLVLMIGSEITILQDTRKQTENNYLKLQQVINDKEAESKDLMYQLLKDTSAFSKKWSDYTEYTHSQNFIVHVFKNDTLVWWTDNTLNSVKYLPVLKEGFFYLNSINGAYLVSFMKSGTFKIAVFYQLKTNYLFQNQYIQNHINSELQFLGSALFSPSPIKDFTDVVDRKGHYLFSVQIFGSPKITPFWLKWVILCIILLIAWFFQELSRVFITRNFVAGSIVFIGLVQSARWMFMKYKVPVFIYNLALFSPDIYASSTFNPSLGDFLIASITLLWYLYLIKDIHWMTGKSRSWRIIRLAATSLLSMTLADAAFDSIRSLVLDSQISFDIRNIYAINIYTFLGLALSFILLLSCFQMTLRLHASLNDSGFSWIEKLIVVGLVFYFLQPYLVIYLFERKTTYLLASNLLLFSYFAYLYWLSPKVNRFQKYFFLVVLLSIFTSVMLYNYSRLEEKSYRVLYAGKLISQNDVNAEYFLNDVERNISESKIIRAYYSNPIAYKSQLVKRLRQLYFSGYLGKYDISVYDFDSTRNHKRTRNLFTYPQVNYIYQQLGSKTINQNFRFLKNNAYLKGYLARFVIRERGEIIGYFFIHLQPKLLQDENRFDELLIDGFRSNYTKRYEYSYAIYRDLQLLSQSGDYAYRTTYAWETPPDKSIQKTENGFEHLIFKENDQLLVVVSKKAPSWYEPFGLFSLAFTFFTLILILFILGYILFNNRWIRQSRFQSNRYWQILQKYINSFLIVKDADLTLIRTQIQLGIVLIVFVTLGATSYFTISYISGQNSVKQAEKLVKKIRSVASAIENESQEVNFLTRQTDAEASINQIADFYNTDITLFNPQGLLVTSTIKKVYDDGIIAPLMNPTAYYHLFNLRESQYVQDEEIATFKYSGAYVPVFAKNRALIGFVQLPNFYQTSDLNAEISSIIVGFINLYALMFIVIGVMAWIVSRNISYPLMLIQKQMAQVSIGKKNEQIEWKRKDEIGQLVKEYNLMIEQLQESAEKLARSEREGAWRDIARQIAHEIKNPLTPMKLSVQHLERAWKDKSPRLPETFEKVTRTLITQIDTLSDLATEFSSFAKMPVPRYELIDVAELIDQVVLLQSQTFEGKISVHCPPELHIHFDAGYLNRTLTNLIKNASQAIPEDREGWIEVNAFTTDDLLVITVEDNGCGISEEQKEKIFMPYFSTKVIGMGLGLPIVKSMIESGGGTISFESMADTGTTFKVTLPLKHTE